jgi:hypothetical protein
MPINIQYGPSIGPLAALAGQGAGQREAFAQDMSLLDVAQKNQELQARTQAQNQAFALQSAYAKRVVAAQTRTPAADHVAERLQLSNQSRQDEQNRTKTQLDAMLEKGTITSEP